MNKKINCLVIIPALGTAFLMLWLFIKALKGEVNKKKAFICYISSALVGFISITGIILLLGFINSLDERLLIGYTVGGYLVNLFAFILVNKKWDDLEEF